MPKQILDNMHNVTQQEWIITLIRYGKNGELDQHAMVAVEGKDDHNAPVRFLIDLNAPGSKPLAIDLFGLLENTPFIVVKRGIKEIRYYAKSQSWRVPVECAENMLAVAQLMRDQLQVENNQEEPRDSILFNIFGKNNIFNFVAGMLDRRYHNCLTWAIEILKFAGINLDTTLRPTMFSKITGRVLKNEA